MNGQAVNRSAYQRVETECQELQPVFPNKELAATDSVSSSAGVCNQWVIFPYIGLFFACIIIFWQHIHCSNSNFEKKTERNKFSSSFEEIEVNTTALRPKDLRRFCWRNHLLPSIIGIGIQKCGTTTLHGILRQIGRIKPGDKKEQHFFQHDGYFQFPELYYTHFPSCKVRRTYEITPSYSNPVYNSAENIRAYYDRFHLRTENIIFLVMFCDPIHRIQSAFYHNLKLKNSLGGFPKTEENPIEYNDWVQWMLDQGIENDSKGDLKRGFYDEIVAHYFDIFPNNKFVFIDSEFAFANEQAVADILAENFKVPVGKPIKPVMRNIAKIVKTNATVENDRRLRNLYRDHLENFRRILQSPSDRLVFIPEKKLFLNASWLSI